MDVSRSSRSKDGKMAIPMAGLTPPLYSSKPPVPPPLLPAPPVQGELGTAGVFPVRAWTRITNFFWNDDYPEPTDSYQTSSIHLRAKHTEWRFDSEPTSAVSLERCGSAEWRAHRGSARGL